MAITKSPFQLLASTLVAAGQYSKSSPLNGAAVDCRTFFGGEITYKITNQAAPTVPLTVVFQVSHNGTDWYDYYAVAGDTTTSSENSAAIYLDRGVMYLRVSVYGNTVNAVRFEAVLQAVTGV